MFDTYPRLTELSSAGSVRPHNNYSSAYNVWKDVERFAPPNHVVCGPYLRRLQQAAGERQLLVTVVFVYFMSRFVHLAACRTS